MRRQIIKNDDEKTEKHIRDIDAVVLFSTVFVGMMIGFLVIGL